MINNSYISKKSVFTISISLLIIAITAFSTNVSAQTRLWSMTEFGDSTNSGSMFNIDLSGNNYNSSPFIVENPGGTPGEGLTLGVDGLLYGMTTNEGRNNVGVIFSYDAATSTYTKIFDFVDSLGENPYGSLMLASDGLLYGLTYNGGLNGNGVLFSFNSTGNVFTKLYDFGSANGAHPRNSLFEASDGLIYGLTELGGINSKGVLFKFNPANNTYSKLYDFGGNDGENPLGALCETSTGLLYGTASNGGLNGNGVIFNYNLNFNLFTKLIDFAGTDGSNPSGSLILAANGLLYGLTPNGGLNGLGVLYSLNTSSNVLTDQFDFNGTLGSEPHSSLIKGANGLLYGMTKNGGLGSRGIIFNFNLTTNLLIKIFDFNFVKGSSPTGSLFLSNNGKMYGLTPDGGISGHGVMFSYTAAGNTFTKLIDFKGSINGSFPWGSLIQAPNGVLYGMTENGGTNNTGALFGYLPGTNTYTKLVDFDTLRGQHPYGSLIRTSTGLLYGMTHEGGLNGSGVIFSFNPVNNNFVKLYDFGGLNGEFPCGSLMQASNGLFYGMTSKGGTNDYGVIFSYNTTGNVFTKLYDFDGINGQYPKGTLIQASNGLLYGLACGDTAVPIISKGVIFSFNITSSAYAKLYDFAGTNGEYPSGSLMQASNGVLYGMTEYGGSNDDGILFNFKPSDSTFTKLIDFNGVNGQNPMGSLIQASNGQLYGMTSKGGINNSGVIFKYNTSNNTYSKLRDLNFPDGTLPHYSSFIETPGISTNTLSASHYCRGASINVSYSVGGTFGPSNIFTVQLSDANGSFASPVNIGTFTSNTSGTITAIIPANTPGGLHYRVRVIGGIPVTYGSDNGSDIVINVNNTSSQNIVACDHYLWNGTNYLTSGNYTANLTNVAGCDSLASLALTIKHSNSSNTTAVACDSLIWNGTKYTSSGNYTKHFNNLVGCDSSAHLALTINHSHVTSSTVAACDSFSWNGIWVVTSGNYTAHFSTSAGCDSTVNLFLTINHNSSSNFSTSACNSYTWNGITYTNSGNYTSHFTNEEGCDSAANLSLTIKRSTTSTLTTGACDTYTWNGTTYTNSGTYTAHFINAAGCDSTATLNLTISHNLTTDVNVASCDSFVWSGTTYSTSGIYSKHFYNGNGCDSLVNLHLTINHNSTSNNNITACDSLLWNGITYTVPGNYSAQLLTAAGCDSTANLSLTINHSSSSTSSASSCDSYTWNGITYSSSGNYSKSFTNASGCDSTANLVLTIKHSSSSANNITACDSYMWNGNTYASSGNYSSHFTNSEGCDSTANLALIINHSSSSSINEVSCNDYVWNGITFTSSGTYSDTLINSAGCDSIAVLNLTIDKIDTNITLLGSDTLMANAVGVSYQWIYCGGNIIPGETNQTYVANSTGAYAVILTGGGCSDTSDCMVLTIGISENETKNSIRIYPNPAAGKFYLEFGNSNLDRDLIEIFDALGRRIYFKEADREKLIEIKLNNPPGIYLLTLNGKYEAGYKIIIE